MLDKITTEINNALYSKVLIILLIAAGIYFTFKTKFVQFRLLKEQLKSVSEKPKDKKAVSSFQAVLTAK